MKNDDADYDKYCRTHFKPHEKIEIIWNVTQFTLIPFLVSSPTKKRIAEFPASINSLTALLALSAHSNFKIKKKVPKTQH